MSKFHYRVRVGNTVKVFDPFRHTGPLKGTVVKLSDHDDGVQLEIETSNSPTYRVGDTIWVPEAECQLDGCDNTKDPKDVSVNYKKIDGGREVTVTLKSSAPLGMLDVLRGLSSVVTQILSSGKY